MGGISFFILSDRPPPDASEKATHNHTDQSIINEVSINPQIAIAVSQVQSLVLACSFHHNRENEQMSVTRVLNIAAPQEA